MKKLFSILLVAMLIVGCIPVTALAASASISGSEHLAEAGDTVTVSFSISSIDLAGFGIDVIYDSSALTLEGASNGTGLSFEPNGSWLVGYANDNVSCGGNLISVTFKVTENAAPGEKYTIGLSVEELFNYDVDGGVVDVDPEVVPGVIEIKAEEKPTDPPHTHEFSDWEVTTAATCTEKGVETRTCACGETETREIPALGHTWGEWEVTKEATCVEAGVETRTCSVCGETETREIAMVAHNYGAWTFCGTDAKHEHKKVCSVCGDEVVADCNDKLQYTDEEKVEGGKNVTEYWQCADCGHEFTKTEFVEITEPTDPVVDPDLDDVPRTDDITGQVVMAGAAALVAMLAAVAFVFKRKAAK